MAEEIDPESIVIVVSDAKVHIKIYKEAMKLLNGGYSKTARGYKCLFIDAQAEVIGASSIEAEYAESIANIEFRNAFGLRLSSDWYTCDDIIVGHVQLQNAQAQ